MTTLHGVFAESLGGILSEFGGGFSAGNLKNFRQFYLTCPDFGKSYMLRSQLSWSQYRLIMQDEGEAETQEAAYA